MNCFSTIEVFGLSKTFTYLGILFGDIGCTMTAATLPEWILSNQIQVELDRQLQECPSKADTLLGFGYEEVSQSCPHCSWRA